MQLHGIARSSETQKPGNSTRLPMKRCGTTRRENPPSFEALRLSEVVIGTCDRQSEAWRMKSTRFCETILIARLFS